MSTQLLKVIILPSSFIQSTQPANTQLELQGKRIQILTLSQYDTLVSINYASTTYIVVMIAPRGITVVRAMSVA